MKKSYLTLSVLAVVASLGGTFASTSCLAQDRGAEAAKILGKAPPEAVAKVKRLHEIQDRLGESFEVNVFKENNTHLKLVAEVKGNVTVRDVVEKLAGGETEVFADIKVHLGGAVDEGKRTQFIKEVADVDIAMKEDPEVPGAFILYECGPNKRNKLAKITEEKVYADAQIYFYVGAIKITVDVGGEVLAKVGRNKQVSVEELVGASVRVGI